MKFRGKQVLILLDVIVFKIHKRLLDLEMFINYQKIKFLMNQRLSWVHCDNKKQIC